MDRAEVDDWYRAYGFAVYRRCRRLLADEAAAWDAVQEVFIRVMRYGSGFSGDEPLKFLYRIADHHCFDRLKERKKNGLAVKLHAELNPQTPEPDRHRLLIELASRCRPKVRDAALLYYLDGMTQEEIAVALGSTRDAIKRRLDRFKEEARRVLEEK